MPNPRWLKRRSSAKTLTGDVEHGMNCNVPLESLKDIMEQHDISMKIDLGAGSEEATVWTCDFSYEYVKINGEYHT